MMTSRLLRHLCRLRKEIYAFCAGCGSGCICGDTVCAFVCSNGRMEARKFQAVIGTFAAMYWRGTKKKLIIYYFWLARFSFFCFNSYFFAFIWIRSFFVINILQQLLVFRFLNLILVLNAFVFVFVLCFLSNYSELLDWKTNWRNAEEYQRIKSLEVSPRWVA